MDHESTDDESEGDLNNSSGDDTYIENESSDSDFESTGNKISKKPWQWTDNDNVVKKFKLNPDQIIQYGISPKLIDILKTKKVEQVTEYDIFSFFVDEKFCENITLWTNENVEAIRRALKSPYTIPENIDTTEKKEVYLKTQTRLHNACLCKKWYDCTIDEIKVFFALVILMGQNLKPSLNQYWSREKILLTPIYNETMPFSRFKMINRFIRLSSINDEQTKSSPQDENPLIKIQYVIDYFIKKFEDNYTPSQNISIDESIMKYKGRLRMKQYIPSKASKVGIKFFKVCESSTGYCSRFQIYTGKNSLKNDISNSKGEAVVFDLAQKYFNKNYVIYTDNWFTSPSLFKRLLEKGTYAVGTCKSNRINYPHDLVKLEMHRGDVRFKSSNNILAFRFIDKNKDVNFLSSYHGFLNMVKKLDYEKKEICKPEPIHDYNQNMGGVDKHDQVIASFPIMRKQSKWYRKLFAYLLDMAIFNSSIIFTIYKNEKDKNDNLKKQNFTVFRQNLVKQILSNALLPDYKYKFKAPLNNPLRFNNQHNIERIPNSLNNRRRKLRCKICYNNKIRKETQFRCKECQVALCQRKCFDKFHELTNKLITN
jgi:hypothetical protein